MTWVSGLWQIGVYFLLCATVALLIRRFLPIPHEVFRKLLHIILLGALAVWVMVFPTWYTAALSALCFAGIVYPLLWVAEWIPGFSAFVTERKKGEMKISLLSVFGMFAIVVALCWGIFGERMLVLASVYAWGFGDAAAALIGKRFGRHPIPCIAGGKKTVEGTLSMWIVSWISVCLLLFLRGGMPADTYILIGLLTAIVSAATEVCTPGGWDTVSCPLLSMGALLILIHTIGGGLSI